MAERPTFTSVISNRGFRFLWFNQILVQLAYNTLNFALIVWVFKLIGSNLAVSALMLSIYLPVMLFGIFAGVFVDLSDRRRIIIFIDLLLAIAFLFFLFIKRSFPLILVNTFLVNSLAQFFMPSESSSIPLLVSRKQLFLANSLFSLTLYGAFMVGFSISGPILNTFGLNAVFYLGAAMLAGAFLLAQNLPTIKVKGSRNFLESLSWVNLKKMFRLTQNEAKETFEFIRGKLSVATAIALMAAVQGVIGVMAVLLPAYLERVLLIHATDASYFMILPLGLGMILGALVVGKLFHNTPKRRIVIPAVIASGILLVLAGVVPTLAQIFQSAELPIHLIRPRYFFRAPSLSTLFAFIAFLSGIALVSIIIPTQTVLQENTNESNRGKIFAVLAVIMTAVSAIPVILAGGLSELFGVKPIFIGLGAAIFILGIVVWRPRYFFPGGVLPYRIRCFLGLGHWMKE